MIPAQVVSTFVCPVCRGGLRLNQDFTRLRCVECGRLYRVQDDIPVLLPPQHADNGRAGHPGPGLAQEPEEA